MMGPNVLLSRAFQLEVCRLSLVQGKCGAHSSLAILLEGNRGGQTQTKAVAGKDGSLLRKVGHMCVSRIVKGGATDHLKGQRAAYGLDGTHEMMLVGSAPHLFDGHKIDDLTDAIHSQKTRDEDVSVWQIELFAPHARCVRRCDTEEAPFFRVEQRPKDA